MNVALLTLTRDRIAYTQHCFARLHEFAGCDFDHYILDNGSTDDTADWLRNHYAPYWLELRPENVGISSGLNLLRDAFDTEYDVVIHFDNDCELTQPNTIRDLAALVAEGDCILSPRILGLNNPPQPTGRLRIGDEIILDIPQIGGICLAAPGWVFEEFRYPENLPKWGMDDATICRWFREQGGTCGYVERLEAWHYLSTAVQQQDNPDYWARKIGEMAADGAA